MSSRRRLLPTLLAFVAGALVAAAALPALAGAASPGRVSFPNAQQQFMCTICHEPLNEARSPEAYQENGYLRQLIARGDSMAQIKHEMIVQFGPGVLADPPKRGFAILIVVVPVAVIVIGLAVLAFTVPRWRRRSARPDDGGSPSPAPRLSDSDARRLDAELARER